MSEQNEVFFQIFLAFSEYLTFNKFVLIQLTVSIDIKFSKNLAATITGWILKLNNFRIQDTKIVLVYIFDNIAFSFKFKTLCEGHKIWKKSLTRFDKTAFLNQ